jgi:hypothetical protein
MQMTANRQLVRRFSIAAFLALIASVAASALIFSGHVAFGVFVGGALGLLNVRGLARGISGLDINNPRPGLLFMGGAVRLLVLFTAIVLIAMTRKVDLIGLLAGFTIVLLVLTAVGLLEFRTSSSHPPGPADDLS